MAKYFASASSARLRRIAIVLGSGKTMSQVKTATGCDYIMNGGLYDMSSGSPVGHLKIDGKVLSAEKWTCFGFGINGTSVKMEVLPSTSNSYISGTELISPGVSDAGKLSYPREVGGRRGRSAMGVLSDGNVVLWCSSDGNSDAKTPEELRDALTGLGCTAAIMLDSGGSSQCDFGNGKTIYSARKVHNYICIWIEHEKTEEEPMDDIKITKMYTTKNPCYTRNEKRVKKDSMLHSTGTPGAMVSSLFNAWNKPTAGAAVEFVIDDTGIYQFLPLGIKSGHCGMSGNNTHTACEVCEPMETVFLPINWSGRPLSYGGKYNTVYAVKRLQQELSALGFDPKGIDGNFGPGCKAAVIAYQKSVGITADGIVGPTALRYLQKREGSHMRYNATLAAAYFKKVYALSVELFAWLTKTQGGKVEDILCHSEGYKRGIASNHADILHWLPQHGKTMDTFRADVKAYMAGTIEPATPLEDAVDKLFAKGVLLSPDYWKGGNYSAANVQALLVKMADAI